MARVATFLLALSAGGNAAALPQQSPTAANGANSGGIGSLLSGLGGIFGIGNQGAGTNGFESLLSGLGGTSESGAASPLAGLLSGLIGGSGGGDFLGIISSISKGFGEGNTANDFTNSNGCKDIIAIIARGSLETGNIGTTTGSYLCTNLRLAYPDRFQCQGIGSPDYTAGVGDNMRPKGTSDTAIAAGIDLFNKAHLRCPSSQLLFEGYSQGAALMHNVIEGITDETRAQIVAGVLFGDTKYQQSGGKIAGFPSEKLKIFCHPEDAVCNARLQVNQYHFAYLSNGDLRRALDFFTSKTDSVLAANGLKVSVPVPDKGVGQPASSLPVAAPKTPKAPTQAPTAAPVQTPRPLPIILPTQAPKLIPGPRPITSPPKGAPSGTWRPRPPQQPQPQPFLEPQEDSPTAPLDPELQQSPEGAISDDGEAQDPTPRSLPRPRPVTDSEDEPEAPAPRPTYSWLGGGDPQEDEEATPSIPIPWLADLESEEREEQTVSDLSPDTFDELKGILDGLAQVFASED